MLMVVEVQHTNFMPMSVIQGYSRMLSFPHTSVSLEYLGLMAPRDSRDNRVCTVLPGYQAIGLDWTTTD